MSINYIITHNKEGHKPNTMTIGVKVYDNPEYESSAFIFEDVEFVAADTNESSGMVSKVAITANLIYVDYAKQKFSTEIPEPIEEYMKELLTQIGEEMMKIANE